MTDMPQRYKPSCGVLGPRMDTSDGGLWIHISDYAAMRAKRDALLDAAIEAHAMLVYQYQSFMKSPSQTDGRYEESMFVWNLEPQARDMMTGCEQGLFDALMKGRAALYAIADNEVGE